MRFAHRRRWRGYIKSSAQRALQGLLDAAGLLAADALLKSVSVTTTSLPVAVVVMTAPSTAITLAYRRFLRPRYDALPRTPAGEVEMSARGCAYIALTIMVMIGGLTLSVMRVAIAALLTPGFDIDGFWSYAATTALGFALMGLATGVWFLVRRSRHTRAGD